MALFQVALPEESVMCFSPIVGCDNDTKLSSLQLHPQFSCWRPLRLQNMPPSWGFARKQKLSKSCVLCRIHRESFSLRLFLNGSGVLLFRLEAYRFLSVSPTFPMLARGESCIA